MLSSSLAPGELLHGGASAAESHAVGNESGRNVYQFLGVDISEHCLAKILGAGRRRLERTMGGISTHSCQLCERIDKSRLLVSICRRPRPPLWRAPSHRGEDDGNRRVLLAPLHRRGTAVARSVFGLAVVALTHLAGAQARIRAGAGSKNSGSFAGRKTTAMMTSWI